MNELTNDERRARVDARAAASGPTVERQFLDSAERLKLDRLDSLSAGLQGALKQIGAIEAHLRIYPNSDSAWASYLRLYEFIETTAKQIFTLTKEAVHIPAKMVRVSVSTVAVTEDWLDTPKEPEQPSWMSSSVKREKRKAAILKENANAVAERECARTGAGRVV